MISLIVVLLVGAGLWFVRSRGHQETAIEGPAVSVQFLDDDLGNAVLVRTPEGKVAVIDPTSRCRNDLAGLLKDEKIHSLAVVVSEPSAERANAIADLQRSATVERVIRFQQDSRQEHWRPMLDRAQCQPMPETIIEPAGSFRLSPTVTLQLVRISHRPEAASDGSCVLRLSYQGKSVLYVSELHSSSEGALISSGANLQSDVLAIGKRGGRDNPSIELLARVRPQVCVLCSNRPTSAALRRLGPENSGATLFRTDKDGIIEIVTDGRSVEPLTGGGQ